MECANCNTDLTHDPEHEVVFGGLPGYIKFVYEPGSESKAMETVYYCSPSCFMEDQDE